MTHENGPQSEEIPAINYPAYFVKAESSDGVVADDSLLVAIDVEIKQGYIEWFDTVKERRFRAIDVKGSEEGAVQFTNPKNNLVYQLTPLNRAVYNQHVRPFLFESRLFETDAELWDALLQTRQDAEG